MREAIAAEIERTISVYPTRLNDLSADLGNTNAMAKRLGYPVECMPVARRGGLIEGGGVHQHAPQPMERAPAPNMKEVGKPATSKGAPAALEVPKFTSQAEFEAELFADADGSPQAAAAREPSGHGAASSAADPSAGSSGDATLPSFV
eukprot:4475600-Pyramimonas_sp.AAC.1